MTPQELKQHRIQLFRDCAAWRKPERVRVPCQHCNLENHRFRLQIQRSAP